MYLYRIATGAVHVPSSAPSFRRNYCSRFHNCRHINCFGGRYADQGTGLRAAVPAPYNWTGSYVGGHFGYGWGGDAIELSSLTAFAVGAVPSSLTDNPRGVLGGMQYGTNWQFNRFVLGWDSDFSFTDIKASQTLVTVPAGVATTTSG